jgi:hypothetical protein
MYPSQQIKVVLDGGGAKGYAHIPVLELIEELGIPIDMIAGNNDSGGECREGACAYADIVSDAHSTSEDRTIFERKVIAVDTGRVSGAEEEILGPTSVGEGGISVRP